MGATTYFKLSNATVRFSFFNVGKLLGIDTIVLALLLLLLFSSEGLLFLLDLFISEVVSLVRFSFFFLSHGK